MSEWKKVKLGNISEYKNEFIVIDNDTEYKRCRVQLHRKGVVLRDRIKGSNLKTKKQRLCKSGYFIVAEMDAKLGGYGIIPEDLHDAIVSSHYYLFELEQSKISIDYMSVLLETSVIQSQIKAKGTTNYSSIRPKEVLNYEIPLPSLDTQLKIVQLFYKYKQANIPLSLEISQQQTLLKKLRQAILQEAIQGKLTADWRKENPNVEPASELLQRIQAEKDKLIAEKKIKKQKPLPAIKDEEIPFELPKGWVWCRLGEIFTFIDYRGKTPKKISEGIRLITAKNVKNGFLSLEPQDFISKDEYKDRMTRGFPKYGDLLFTTEAPLGNISILDIEEENITTGQRLITLQSSCKDILNKLLMFFMLSLTYKRIFLKNATGVTAKGIKASKLRNIIIPLPSLSEQKAIVAKVEKLLAYCDELEQQINQSKTYSEQLMQVVLKEAFAPSNLGNGAKSHGNRFSEGIVF